MVYLHLHMFREIGETLSATAHSQLRAPATSGGKEWVMTSAVSEHLLAIMRLFTEAAESFTKEDCCRDAHRCLAMARLVALQVQTPQIRFIGLSPADLKRVFVQHPSFGDASVVAEA